MSQEQHRPSVASLARALAAPEPGMARAAQRIGIARPPLRERILLLGLLIALPFLGLATIAAYLMLAQHVAEARGSIRERERHAREDLPAEAVLLDAAQCRLEMAARPVAAGNLLLARCRLLAAAGRWADLDATVTAVATETPGAILPETRLLLAEALLALARPLEAGGQLHRLAGLGLDEPLAQRLAELSARVWAATAPPASALRPAEQADQPATK